MIKVIVFDIGNVVWFYDALSQKLLKEFSLITHTNYPYLLDQYNQVYTSFETNKLSVVDWLNTVNQSCNPITQLQIDKLMKQVFNTTDFNKYKNKPVINLIKKLKSKGFVVMMLSNAENFGYPYIQKRLEKLFDFSLISNLEGIRKPNPAIYQKIFKFKKYSPRQIVYIDDKPINVEVAKDLGLNGILFQNYRQLAKDLKPYINAL